MRTTTDPVPTGTQTLPTLKAIEGTVPPSCRTCTILRDRGPMRSTRSPLVVTSQASAELDQIAPAPTARVMGPGDSAAVRSTLAVAGSAWSSGRRGHRRRRRHGGGDHAVGSEVQASHRRFVARVLLWIRRASLT
jgi:hypothetical protein